MENLAVIYKSIYDKTKRSNAIDAKLMRTRETMNNYKYNEHSCAQMLHAMNQILQFQERRNLAQMRAPVTEIIASEKKVQYQ